MADAALETYLNDHLGGATLGSDLADQLREQTDGTTRSELLARIAAEVEEDRETLVELMDALDVSRNPIKQAGGWLAEKASRVKFSGAGSGDPGHGLFMALETLRLGVAGKRCLWLALREVRGDYEPLARFDLDRLIERAVAQEAELERERIAVGAEVLAAGTAPA